MAVYVPNISFNFFILSQETQENEKCRNYGHLSTLMYVSGYCFYKPGKCGIRVSTGKLFSLEG